MIIPALYAGRSLSSLLEIYYSQAMDYPFLTVNAPTVYQFIEKAPFIMFHRAGVLLTAFIVYFLLLLLIQRKLPLTRENLVRLSMVSVLVLPYFLPRMHERYFFLADLISVVYAFYFPRYFFVPLAIGAVSALSYTPFLFHQTSVDFRVLSTVMGFMAAMVTWDLAKAVMEAYRQPGAETIRAEGVLGKSPGNIVQRS
jgi:Gpi18-like mannosyltransferase